ncbi:MAG: DUF1343 domain-containing protein [Bacteroidota bacterium]|nr:DUF1343 domain-containing protein [Bacteroidota bacterium]
MSHQVCLRAAIITMLGLITVPSSYSQSVRTGAMVLADAQFDRLQGMRVGLVVNHTARVGEEHLINLVHAAPGVSLVALFGPEHGLRGLEEDGVSIADGIDDLTGAPVYSLYGTNRRPTPAMLADVDVLVFDIQDVGARFYTFISTMGLAMQSAAESGIPFIVLDRPNPLSGSYVSGFVLEPDQSSFVGMYPIPIAHGLTIGELAQMIRGEALMPGLDSLNLEVIRMENWERHMQWPDTGLPWVNTSPNIPDFMTALVYPGTCFFESTSASEGRGTPTPFTLVGAPWADPAALVRTLTGYALPGVSFEGVTFTPEPTEGMDTNPKLSGELLGGLQITVTSRRDYRPVETGIHIFHTFYRAAPNPDQFLSRPQWLARLSGTVRLEQMLSTAGPAAIVDSWQQEVEAFSRVARLYHLYD